MNKRRLLSLFAAFILCITTLTALAGCGGKGSGLPLDANDDARLILRGLSAEDIVITVADLKKLDSVTCTEQATRHGGEIVEVEITGPLLSTILEQYNAKQTDFKTIRLNASDDYSIAISGDKLENDEIIIGYYDYGEPMDTENGPIRAIIPGERAMYWVRMLSRIDFEKEGGAQTAETLYMLDTALEQLTRLPYTADGGDDLAVSCQELADTYAPDAYADSDSGEKNVFMLAADGLQKNETQANFLANFIKITGTNAPKFTGPDLPEGMSIMDLVSIRYGNTAFLSIAKAAEVIDPVYVDDFSGIPVSSVLSKIGGMTTDTYLFKDTAGSTARYTFDELSNSIIYIDADGKVIFCADTNQGGENTLSAPLLSISAIDEE